MNRCLNCRTVLLTILAVAALARTAEATITRIGLPTKLANAANAQPNDIAYDDKHGVYLIVWSDAGNGGHVYGKFVDAATNTPVSGLFRISRNEQLYATMPRVAYSSGSADDEFIVTFRSDVNLYDQGANIYAQRLHYNAAVTPDPFEYIGDPFPISVNSTNVKAAQYPGGIVWNKNARQFLVTWWQDYNGQDAFARVFNADGTPFNNDKNLSNTTWWQGAPNAAYDPVTNRYLVVYQGDDPTGTTVGCWAQLVDGATGDPIGSTLTLSTGGFQAEESVVYLPERQAFLVLWTMIPYQARTVVGRLVDANGVPLGDTYPLVSFSGSPISTGAGMAAYNSVSHSVMMVCMDDMYIWGSELDAAGNVLQTMQMSSAPPSSGSWTPNVTSGLQGAFGMSYVLNQAAVWFEQFQGSGGPTLPPLTTRPATDFNGDGKGDIVWRNRATGAIVVWYMNGAGGYTGYTTMSAGDANWRIGAVADFNGDSLPDVFLRNVVTGANQIAFNDGRGGFALMAVWALPDASWRIGGAGDFNGDRKADIVWHNVVTGESMVWFGPNCTASAALPSVSDNNWTIRGVGDFNQDGKPDILWRNMATGANLIWYMNGVSYVGFASIDSQPDLRWAIVAVADLSGDGKPDIIWRNGITGEDSAWVMDNTTRTAVQTLPTVDPIWDAMLSAYWPGAGPSDMDADGSSDIVWHQAATGENSIWFMNRTTVRTMTATTSQTDVNWTLVGSGDFNGDEMPDLVWRNFSTGANRVWFMNGATYLGSADLPPVADRSWQIVGVADFNSDGKVDLLWRNTATGAVVVWYMNGVEYANWAALPTVTSTDWQVAGTGDFDKDGAPDVVWHNVTTGEALVWYLRDSTYVGWAALPRVADTNWKIVAVADFDADRSADILWRNYSTGQNLIWLLDGVTYKNWIALPTEPNTNWKVAGPTVR